MNLHICENIKRLRKEKNITQEKLAEHLGISYQAVSKWERGETYPDITLLIPLASYFNVSTDVLLGVDHAKNEAKIQEYWKEYQELFVQGKQEEMSELIKRAYKEFPNHYRIMLRYAALLVGGRASDYDRSIVLTHADEATSLCERILAECPDDTIRNEAVISLAVIAKAQGNINKALEILARLPNWYTTSGQTSEQLFEKGTEEWWKYVAGNFWELANFAQNKLLKIIWYSDKPFDEREKSSLKIVEYLEKILEETNCELLYRFISLVYNEIGCWYRREGKNDGVSKYFDLGLSYAIKFDDFVESDRQFPFKSMQEKQNYAKFWGDMGKYNSMLKRELAWYENNPWFEELRELDSFNAMLEKWQLLK